MTAVLRILPLLLCCLLALALPRAAAAQDPFAAAAAGLAGDFSEKIEAIEKLAALGYGRAVPILQALGDGNLLVPMREALRARCTIGEVCELLRGEWGMYDSLR